MSKSIEWDWNNLGFEYIKTDFRYISTWKDGNWDKGSLTDDNYLHISEASCALHYGQQCFEGLKAYRTKDGSIQLFRPDRNAERLNSSLRKLLMPEIPVEKFIDACIQVVKANEHFVPPYGSGATLYLRPFVIGVGHNIGVKPAPEYIFSVFCTPVGAYFKGGLTPCNFNVAEYDRAAPRGTGHTKVGGKALPIVFILIQQLKPKLKKLVQQTFLVLQKTMNLLHQNHLPYCRASQNIHLWK